MKKNQAGILLLTALVYLACKTANKDLLPPPPPPLPPPTQTDTIFKDTAYNGLSIRDGLTPFFNKLENGGPVQIVYLGGSITQANGYRVQTMERLQHDYPKAQITGFNAGVGGTGSDLGIFRMDDEVLPHRPDLVFVEFAVNDQNTDTTQICKSMEGIVRKIKSNNPATGICFVYTISLPMLQYAIDRKEGNSIRMMQKIAAHYGISSINLGYNVADSLKAGRLIFTGTAADAATGKIVFTNDNTHPTEAGHRLYTNTIMDCFNILKKVKKVSSPMPVPFMSGHFQYATTLRPDSLAISAGWKPISSAPLLKPFQATFPNLVYSSDLKDSIVIQFKGSVFGIEDVMGPGSHSVSIFIDGVKKYAWDRFDRWCTSNRRNSFMIPPLTNSDHRIVLRLNPKPLDKFKILNSTVPLDTAQFSTNYIYIGKILLLREP